MLLKPVCNGVFEDGVWHRPNLEHAEPHHLYGHTNIVKFIETHKIKVG